MEERAVVAARGGLEAALEEAERAVQQHAFCGGRALWREACAEGQRRDERSSSLERVLAEQGEEAAQRAAKAQFKLKSERAAKAQDRVLACPCHTQQPSSRTNGPSPGPFPCEDMHAHTCMQCGYVGMQFSR